MGNTFTTEDNDELVDKLVSRGHIKTPSIEKVFRTVDRGFYFLPSSVSHAYRNRAWKHGNIHISAPCIYTKVMECLQLQPGHSFLNLGSGTGYLSTLAGLLIGPHGINHGIELYEDVIDYAYSKLKEFREKCSAIDSYEFAEPVFVHGNGFSINRNRQYDRIYCGAGCPETHLDFVKDLLKVNGILVVPCNEELLKITKISETDWESRSVFSVSFSMLRLPDKEVKIDLPDSTPLPLMDICRACIRRSLREIVDKENPDVQKVPIRVDPNQPTSSDGKPFRIEYGPSGTATMFYTADFTTYYNMDVFDDNKTTSSESPRSSESSESPGSSESSESSETSISSDFESSSETNNSQMSDKEEQKMMDDAGNGRQMTDKKRNRERRNHTSPYCRKRKFRARELKSRQLIGSSSYPFPIATSVSSIKFSPRWNKRATKYNRAKYSCSKITYRVAIQEKIKLLPLPLTLKLYLNYYREINDN